jgi:predicted dehydrogenase
VEIHGTEGAYVHTSGGPEGEHTWWGKNGEWTEVCPYAVHRPWRQGSDNFAHSVRTGAPLDICGEQGRLSRLILDAIYKSARNDGEWIDV